MIQPKVANDYLKAGLGRWLPVIRCREERSVLAAFRATAT